MKISTILMGAALVAFGGSAYAQNLMENATAGATGQVEGPDAPLVQDGWQLYNCPFEYDPLEEEYMFGDVENITESWPANVRLENWAGQTNGDGEFKCEFDGASYDQNVAFFRWDSNGSKYWWYAFPVEIEKTGLYTFSCLAGEWNNFNDGNSANMYVKQCGFRATIAQEVGPEYLEYETEPTDEELEQTAMVTTTECGKYFEVMKGNDRATLTECAADFTLKKTGTYYLCLQGAYALYAFGDFNLSLTKEIEFGGDGVETVEAAMPVSTKYYGIDGVEVINPANGAMVIEKTTLENGAVKVAKRVIR